ncbi:MAG: hypothetical protein ACRDY6_06730 [Acidimicrobiia bacterium]
MQRDRNLDGQARAPMGRWCATARVALVAIAVGLPLSAGCGSGSADDDEESQGSRDPTSTTEAEWPPEQRAALDTYQGYLDVIDQALTAPLDPTVPELDQYATPEAAQDIRLRASGFEQLGRAVRPQTRFDAEKITIDGDDATIVGCLTDAGVVYEVATGAVINDDSVRHVATTTLTRADDADWLVTGSDAGRPGVPCDA